MAHTIYSNFYLSNEIEDAYKSHLDLTKFCKVDNTLVGTPGMERKINVYSAVNGAEKLAMGAGNTKSIEVKYTERPYTIALAQSRFEYFDEQNMTDPMLVPTGLKYMGADMFNTVNADIFAEYNKAKLKVQPKAYDFGAFADALSLINIEGTDNDPQDINAFGFVNPKDMALVRKALKDDLKYVESFARTGYVGTVAGINLYTKKDAVAGTCIVGVKDAVTLFNKKGTEIEQQRDANIRKNSIYSRKYYVAALTDESKAVKIIITP